MRIILIYLLSSLALVLAVSACGGGGGGGSGNTAEQPAPDNPVPPVTPLPEETFTLAGTITTSDSQAVDSDTNDPLRPNVSNDTPTTAQTIFNPITLGGYINQPGAGAPGRSQQAGDINDFFAVELLAGQSITMLVGDFIQADADLYLWDTQGNIVDFSIDTGEVEFLVAPSDGSYLVNVLAFAGATNYVLAIGASNLPALQQPPQYDIVPWQAVVTYKEGNATSPVDASQNMGLEQATAGNGRARLMRLRRQALSARQRERRVGTAAAKRAGIRDPDLVARWETLMTVKSLRNDPDVRSAKPNYQVSTQTTPNDEAFPFQWHYPLIGLPQAWETTSGDPSVVVAVIDTGILANHPDLNGQLVDGYDFVRDPDSALDGDGIDSNPQDPGASFGGGSQSFHGTHVSGTVAARGNNRVGVAGAAYGARIMPLRALGAGGVGTSYDINQAVRYAAGLPNDSGTVPTKPADVINLSLGGAPFDQDTQNLYNQVREAGVVVVAAAGNATSTQPLYPASYDGVISVSAVDTQRRLTAYSNTGPTIDVAAPGGNSSIDLNGDGFPDGVLSTNGVISEGTLNFVYSFLNGTSMAAPHVAAVVALMKSVNPTLTPATVDRLLVAGALSDDLGAPGRDNLYGYGLINAQRAVLAALEAGGSAPTENPRLVASASTLNFGSTSTALALNIQNGGTGDLALLQLSVSEPWLQIDPVTVDASGFGNYSVSVDRSALVPGIYAADITAQSTVNSLTVRVLAAQSTGDRTADVGVLYILLYDPASGATVTQVATSGDSTGYPYELSAVPAGEYEIIAGTDTDNDLFICDAGEACGAWLTVDQPVRIQLQDNVTQLDFPVEYLVSLPNIRGAENKPERAPMRRKIARLITE